MSTSHPGIIEPPVDRLLDKADSKYGLVIFAARRARQINAYYSQLHEGLFEYVGPLVDVALNEKSLSVSLREIDAGLLSTTVTEQQAEFTENGQLLNQGELGVQDLYSDFFPQDGAELDSSMVFSETPEDDTVQEAAPEEGAAEEQAEVPSDEPSEN